MLHPIIRLAVVLVVCAQVACAPSGGNNTNDGDYVVKDPNLSEGEGEGELCDGGACADAGVTSREYTGTAEPGVVCNDAPCPVGERCCVGQAGGTCSEGGVCTGALAQFACDGAEDCAAGEECCLQLASFSSTCVAAGTCVEVDANNDGTPESSSACINTAGCDAEQLCCTVEIAGVVLPVDMGGCAAAANACAVAVP